jgi:predicted phosphodiesterase
MKILHDLYRVQQIEFPGSLETANQRESCTNSLTYCDSVLLVKGNFDDTQESRYIGFCQKIMD